MKIGTAISVQRTHKGIGAFRVRPGIVSHHKASPRETA